MLRLIIRVHANILADIHAAFEDRSDGNPTGQKRMERRIRESGGRLLFDVILEPGKRGRYELILTECIGWNAATGTAIRAGWNIIEGHADDDDTHPIPEKPWLGCRLTRIKSKGRGCYEVSRRTSLLITHHALSRLAQRCNAREAIDLVLAVRAIWHAYVEVDVKALEDGTDLFVRPAGQRISVKLPEEMGEAVVVLCPHDNRPRTIVVATILPPGSEEAAA
jgi:hypothetical protein